MMSDKIPMFPTAHPPRADEDTATIEQVLEHVPGEIELDRIVKAQTSGPHIARRMGELENSICRLSAYFSFCHRPHEKRLAQLKQLSRHDYFFIEAWCWTIIWSYPRKRQSDTPSSVLPVVRYVN